MPALTKSHFKPGEFMFKTTASNLFELKALSMYFRQLAKLMFLVREPKEPCWKFERKTMLRKSYLCKSFLGNSIIKLILKWHKNHQDKIWMKGKSVRHALCRILEKMSSWERHFTILCHHLRIEILLVPEWFLEVEWQPRWDDSFWQLKREVFCWEGTLSMTVDYLYYWAVGFPMS